MDVCVGGGEAGGVVVEVEQLLREVDDVRAVAFGEGREGGRGGGAVWERAQRVDAEGVFDRRDDLGEGAFTRQREAG